MWRWQWRESRVRAASAASETVRDEAISSNCGRLGKCERKIAEHDAQIAELLDVMREACEITGIPAGRPRLKVIGGGKVS